MLGVNVAMQRETQRQRQLEFLQITANPIDMQIMGPVGRANVLRPVADGIGLEGDTIVPPEEEIKAMAQQDPPGGGPPPPGGGPGGPGGGPTAPPGAPAGGPPGGAPGQVPSVGPPKGPRTNLVPGGAPG